VCHGSVVGGLKEQQSIKTHEISTKKMTEPMLDVQSILFSVGAFVFFFLMIFYMILFIREINMVKHSEEL